MTELSYRPGVPRIPDTGLKGRDGHDYFPHADLLAAANAALAVEMPLLLTGEAGCGKTDFAFAVAGGLAPPGADAESAEPLECYVRSDSRARDLLYHYDAVRRFGDAQQRDDGSQSRARDPRQYIRLKPLGEALMSRRMRVVLIDEIDKAPRDLPNDLLRELDQGHFEIPEIPVDPRDGDDPSAIDPADPETYRNQMKRPTDRVKPLVIITSNVERQLPDPFLRRCVFFHIPFPNEVEIRQMLVSRFDGIDGLFFDRVIDVFEALRAVPALAKKPATSELIKWVEAMKTLYEPALVHRALDDFAGGSLPKAQARGRQWSELRWSTLPVIGCLIKLREDRDRLQIQGA